MAKLEPIHQDLTSPVYSQEFPPGTVVIPTGYLARYSVFNVCLMATHLPAGSHVEWSLGMNLAGNINSAIRRATGEWIWLMGDDHLWAPDTLLRLLARNVPIISPICLLRAPPYMPLVFRSEHTDGSLEVWPVQELPTSGMHQVLAASSAGMLVQRWVFDKIAHPIMEIGQIRTDELGEDLWFAKKVRDAGIPWYLDCDTVIGHITPTCLWPTKTEGRWDITLDPSCQIPLLSETPPCP